MIFPPKNLRDFFMISALIMRRLYIQLARIKTLGLASVQNVRAKIARLPS